MATKTVQTSLLGFYTKDGKTRPITAPKGTHRATSKPKKLKLPTPKLKPKLKGSSRSKKCRHGKYPFCVWEKRQCTPSNPSSCYLEPELEKLVLKTQPQMANDRKKKKTCREEEDSDNEEDPDVMRSLAW